MAYWLNVDSVAVTCLHRSDSLMYICHVHTVQIQTKQNEVTILKGKS